MKIKAGQFNAYRKLLHWGKPSPSGKGSCRLWVNRGRKGSLTTAVEGAARLGFGNAYAVGSTNICDGQWHHVVAVYKGGTSKKLANTVSIYIDGNLDHLSARKDGIPYINTNSASSRPLSIGSMEYACDIDELYVIEGALSQDEVMQLFTKNRL